MNVDVSKPLDIQHKATDHDLEHVHQWDNDPAGMANQDKDKTRAQIEAGAEQVRQQIENEKPNMDEKQAGQEVDAILEPEAKPEQPK